MNALTRNSASTFFALRYHSPRERARRLLIRNAASMFFASPTGRRQRGDAAVRALAGQVVRRLKHEIDHHEVVFEKLPKDVSGLSYEGLASLFHNHILVSKRLEDDVTATSFTLVHEAAHLVLSRPYVEEEVLCRTLESYYLDDLAFSTAHWDYPTDGGRQVPAAKFNPLAPPSPYLKGEVEQWEWFARDQLLDYVLLAGEYSRSLTAGWVRDHFEVSGGIANRTGETKALYVGVLARSGGAADARLVLRVLQSVPAGDRDEWDEVVGGPGGLAAVRKGLAPLRQPGVGTAQEGQAIQRLEAQWHASL